MFIARLLSALPIPPLLALSLLVLSLLAFAGCAAPPGADGSPEAASPAEPPVTVTTDPAGARCRATGARQAMPGQAAPFTLDPGLLGYPVEVICSAAGHLDRTEMVTRPIRDPITRGIARGDLVAVMVSYQPRRGEMLVTLPLAEFQDAAARDTFYGERHRVRAERWQFYDTWIRQECDTPAVSQAGRTAYSLPLICRQALNRLQQQREADLRNLEIERRRAAIR